MRTTTLMCLAAIGSSITIGAAQSRPAGSLTDVTGVWIMSIEGHQLGLELEQKGTVVKGVMLVMGTRQLLDGTYIDRMLTLKGERIDGGDGGPAGDPNAGPIVGKMLDDGTFEGELSTPRGRAKWTGERLRKQQASIAATPRVSFWRYPAWARE